MTEEEPSQEPDGLEDGSSEESTALQQNPSDTEETLLLEVSPGIAVLFGEVPDGMDLLNLPIMPEKDKAALAELAGFTGNAATVAGRLEERAQLVKGVYRIDDVSQKLLDGGAKMAQKDGANLGGIFKGGKSVRQARFTELNPLTAPSLLAAAGPAISMMAIQAQLGNIEDLVATNITLTRRTLKTIRDEQWSELEGIVNTIARAFLEANQVGMITDSIWEQVAGHRPLIDKQLQLYRRNVTNHTAQIRELGGQGRREYLEAEAETIVFDAHALLQALKSYAQYRTLRAAQVRNRIEVDETEKALFELLTEETPKELEKDMREVRELILELTRELRIISELPGRATVPLTKKRRDKKRTALTCAELLEVIEPLSDMLQPAAPTVEVVGNICGPEEVNLDKYFGVLRWYLAPREVVETVAVAYLSREASLAGAIPGVLRRRVDAVWDARAGNIGGPFGWLAPGGALVAVTDSRVIVADQEKLAKFGQIDTAIPRAAIQLVRNLDKAQGVDRRTVEIITDEEDVRIMFPGEADKEKVGEFADVLKQVETPPQLEATLREGQQQVHAD